MRDGKIFNVWTQELIALEKIYRKTERESQFVLIYGRRRIGKTALLKEFIHDKPYLYFLCTKSSIKDQLKKAGETVLEHFGGEKDGQVFANWGELLKYIAQKALEKDQRLVLIFDELPTLIGVDKPISNAFKEAWEKQLKNSKILLIMAGSKVVIAKKGVLDLTTILYSQRTNEIQLSELSFTKARELFNSGSFEELFSLFAIVGGIPGYLSKLDSAKSIRENIEENILSKDSFLFFEPELLLSEEFIEPRKYFMILEAIGLGWAKYGDVLGKTGLPNNVLSKYLNTLISSHLVKRKVPITEDPRKSKKGKYFIYDKFLRFYFNFVLPNLSKIELGEMDNLFAKNKTTLNVLIERTYETFAKELIWQETRNGNLPEFDPMDRWWERNVKIDTVGINGKLNAIIFAKTKWGDEPLGISALTDLKQKAKLVRWGRKGRKEYYILFSKAGFTDELKKIASKEHVILVQGDKILKLQ